MSETGKATVEAPSNIAFLKYWGAIDLDRALPSNVSLSMTLSHCVTHTTIERREQGLGDSIEVKLADGDLAAASPGFAARAEGHLGALRRATGVVGSFRVATANTFPSAAGIASSASGFAALACAFGALLEVEPTPHELSLMARSSGSGSAARSVLGGFVEWPGESDNPEAPARQVATADHWELCDLIAVVSSSAKKVSSRDGHVRAPSSPHFARRQQLLPERLEAMREAVLDRDLGRLGPAIEAEAIDLHLIAMSSLPPIFYWLPETLAVLARARELRAEGLEVWATMDAGPNVHLICEPRAAEEVVAAVASLAGVEKVIPDRVGSGPRRSENHLF